MRATASCSPSPPPRHPLPHLAQYPHACTPSSPLLAHGRRPALPPTSPHPGRTRSAELEKARAESERRQQRKQREKAEEAERRRVEDEGCTWGFQEDAREEDSDGEGGGDQDGAIVAGDDEQVGFVYESCVRHVGACDCMRVCMQFHVRFV